MTTTVDALFAYRVTDEARFAEYTAKVFPLTEADEPYVLGYEIFRGDDGTFYQHERYADEAAIWKHMEVTAACQADFAASTEMISVTMLGDLSDKFRETFGVTTSYTSFRRIAR